MIGQESKNRKSYPRQFKRKVAEEVVLGIKGLAEAARYYDISVRTLGPWVGKYRAQLQQNQLNLSSMTNSKKDKGEEDPEARIKALEEEVMQLRKKLHEEQIRTEALNTLIDLAEDTYKLGLRKNSGAKQSDK